MKKKRVIRTVNGFDLDRCDLDLWCRRGLAQRSCLDLLWRAQRAILFFSAARPRPAICNKYVKLKKVSMNIKE